MLDLTKLFYFLFGAITLAGGLQGYFAKGSVQSLIAGGVSGILLLLAGWLVQTGKVTPGIILGLVISLALAGRFLPLFLRTGGWWPAGAEGWLGFVGLVLSILALIKR
ncbi:MAG TPA: TMEM14 family protein [Chthoniobacteraceae bacterium]|jgi:uncharacterized membrane protein (UPF0136 family)